MSLLAEHSWYFRTSHTHVALFDVSLVEKHIFYFIVCTINFDMSTDYRQTFFPAIMYYLTISVKKKNKTICRVFIFYKFFYFFITFQRFTGSIRSNDRVHRCGIAWVLVDFSRISTTSYLRPPTSVFLLDFLTTTLPPISPHISFSTRTRKNMKLYVLLSFVVVNHAVVLKVQKAKKK